jgi:hypothetical protein
LKHVMLDFETWGTARKSCLRSIGAVSFDPFSDAIDNRGFYANIQDESMLTRGFTKDPDTVSWWSRQAREAQDALLVDQRSIEQVLKEFHSWWLSQGAECVWAQGSNFDPGLWEDVCIALNARIPWKFWNTRDTRTVYDISGISDKSIQRQGTHHNALHDAMHQVKAVQAGIRKLLGTAQQQKDAFLS